MTIARPSLTLNRKRLLIPQLVTFAVAAILIFLVFFALHTHRRSAQAVARQHNLQHMRLIEIVTASLENRLINMQAAFKQYAALIVPPFEAGSGGARVRAEIRESFPTVSSAFIVQADNKDGFWTAELSQLTLTSDSLARLEQAAAEPNPHLLLVRSIQGENLLVFLSPIRNAPAHLGVVVPLERLIATYHLNDPGYDEDYVWILDRDGTLVYHRHKQEMIGRNIHKSSTECVQCHKSFDLEKQMVLGTVGYGWNEVPKGSGKIVAYAPLNVANLHWVIAISEAMDATTAVVRRSTREYTLNAVLLAVVIFATSVYVARTHYLKQQAEQKALHLYKEHLLQQQLDRKHRELLEAERFATVGRMASQVAHEIKNPLSSISLNAELLGDELEAEGRRPTLEARQLVDSILSEIDLLTETIDDYLQFARFPKLQKEPTSLGDLFAGLQQLLLEESAFRAITLQFSACPSVGPFPADARLLRQALLNLIRNSFDAIGSNGWVRLEAAGENGDLRIEVMDSGPGVSAEDIPMLFQPFFTTKPKGTGLGLPLTRHIIFQHGGSISYEPTPDTVSRFVIRLPLESMDPQEEPA